MEIFSCETRAYCKFADYASKFFNQCYVIALSFSVEYYGSPIGFVDNVSRARYSEN
jgi:hypothetical protein